MNQKDHKITIDEFEEAVSEVLFAPSKAKYENRKPSKEELEVKWKLEKE